jgi:guanylate kinase
MQSLAEPTRWGWPLADTASRPTPPPVDRVAASKAAVAARRARAAVKAAVASGKRSAVNVLQTATNDPRSPEGTLRVTEFLMSIPAIGVAKMHEAMDTLDIANSKRLGGLGALQRARLENFLRDRAARPTTRSRSRLVVLAGPTAVGKGTVASHIRDNYPNVLLSVSATTRSPRPGEVEGVNYYFVDDAQFDRLIADGELLEWATVHNAYRYGTPRAPILDALTSGRSVLLEIDLQGARQVRAAMPQATLVFLAPPSWDELVRRLVGRGTEDAEERQRRLATAREELAAQAEFDEVVVNGDVGEAAREVVDLMEVRRSDTHSSPQKEF